MSALSRKFKLILTCTWVRKCELLLLNLMGILQRIRNVMCLFMLLPRLTAQVTAYKAHETLMAGLFKYSLHEARQQKYNV